MILDIGIKLVFSLPSILFFITFIFKSITEKHHLKKISDPQIFSDIIDDFQFIVGIESEFMLIINGLIIIFELKQNEIGIILILLSLLLSNFLLLGSHLRHPNLISIGFVGMFLIIGWELGYFWFYDFEKILIFGMSRETIMGLISSFIGLLILRNFLFSKPIAIKEKMTILEKNHIRMQSLVELIKSDKLTSEELDKLIMATKSDRKIAKNETVLILDQEISLYEMHKIML